MSITPRIVELKGVDPETAFIEAQQNARHIYGNSGQTGTIADADGFIIVNGPALLPWDCRRAAQQVLRDGHAKSGGPVFLLRLADPARTRSVKTAVEITDLGPGQVDDAVDAAVRAKLPDDTWGIVGVELRTHAAEGEERKGVRRAKSIVTVGKGPKVTKYVIKSELNGATLRVVDTLAEAKSLMKELIEAQSGPLSCAAEVTRESGPLITAESKVLKETAIVLGTLGTPAPAGNGTYLAAGFFPSR